MRSAFVKTPEQNHQTLLNACGDARRKQGEKVKGDRVTLECFISTGIISLLRFPLYHEK